MADLPSGTVTFLFTDVEGSTRLLYELGDDYADQLRGHRTALREAFSRHGGVEVDFSWYTSRPSSSPRRDDGSRRAIVRGSMQRSAVQQ